MEEWANSLFSEIENFDTEMPDFSTPQAYNSSNLGNLYRIEPVMDSNSLTIVWFLPYAQQQEGDLPFTLQESWSLMYHSHILGHEGEGSLLSSLIKDGLATSSSTYVDHVLKTHVNFYVDVQLTEKGVKNYEEVVERIWAQIRNIKDKEPQKYIFEDYQKVSQLRWQFLEKSGYSSYATWLASQMQKYDESNIENVLKYAVVVDEFNPELIDQFTNQIYDHNNCNIYLTTQDNIGKTDLKEKWYGTNFAKHEFDEVILGKITETKNYQELTLPNKNKYLPDNVDLLPKNDEWSKDPIKIKDNSDHVIWYKKDDKFGQPKCQITLRIYKKKNDLLEDSNSLKQVYNDIWTDVYDELLR